MSSDAIESLVDNADGLLESRTGRWLFAVLSTLVVVAEVAILVSGYWPNVGSAPPGVGCRYWTGLKLVYRPTFDPLDCPLHIQRASKD